MNPITALIREHRFDELTICSCPDPGVFDLTHEDPYDFYMDHIKELSIPLLEEIWQECWHRSAESCRNAWHWDEHAEMPRIPYFEKEKP